MMKMKEPLQEKHHQKTAKHPLHRVVNGMRVLDGMRDQVQQRHAQHEAGDETDGGLQSRVGQVHQHRQPASGEGGDQYQRAIDDEQPSRGIHAFVYD